MIFSDIFEDFKNYSCVRRKSWSELVYMRRHKTSMLIQMFAFLPTTNGKDKAFVITKDCRLNAEDLFADDWIVITTDNSTSKNI